MFRKPFVVKKNVNLRNSDTRKLISKLPGNVAATVDKKAQVAHVKLITFNNMLINLYTFDKEPLFFDYEDDGVIFPTMFYLWKHPAVYPTILVYSPTLQYLENGADLMLPGVLRNVAPLPEFEKGDCVVVSLFEKGQIKGPVSVGAAFMSSRDAFIGTSQGKVLQTLHVFRDNLWEFGPRGTPPVNELSILSPPPVEENSVSGTEEELNIQDIVLSKDSEAESPSPTPAAEDSNVVVEEAEEDIEPMENLLLRCFIAGLKFRFKKSGTLPLDVGQFYSQCLLKCVPSNKRLDMKKTKYKKFGTFLDEINKHEDGIFVKITKKNKGADVISEINWAHPSFRSFELTDEVTTEPEEKKSINAPTIHEYFSVTEPVLKLFRTLDKLNKGDLLEAKDIKYLVTEYVKKENLAAGSKVKLDPILADVSNTNSDVIDWNSLMQKIQSRMTKTFVIRMPNGKEIIRKISMPEIVFKVETRSGNKKVTLVNNSAVFGLDPKTICHQIQVGVAASATLNPEAVNCEGPQLVIQGNQVVFIGDLLMKEYGVDKKFIKGLELAPKRKK